MSDIDTVHQIVEQIDNLSDNGGDGHTEQQPGDWLGGQEISVLCHTVSGLL